ncbi:hypothetical protein AtNW77_Chr5g0153481 [Arabidopsis thaliana]
MILSSLSVLFSSKLYDLLLKSSTKCVCCPMPSFQSPEEEIKEKDKQGREEWIRNRVECIQTSLRHSNKKFGLESLMLLT